MGCPMSLIVSQWGLMITYMGFDEGLMVSF
jgi:hypothetical protein